jgi:hypothetical protein
MDACVSLLIAFLVCADQFCHREHMAIHGLLDFWLGCRSEV